MDFEKIITLLHDLRQQNDIILTNQVRLEAKLQERNLEYEAFLLNAEKFDAVNSLSKLSMLDVRKMLGVNGQVMSVEKVNKLVETGELDCIRNEDGTIPKNKRKFLKSHLITYFTTHHVKSLAYEKMKLAENSVKRNGYT